MTSYNHFADEFYVNMTLNTEMDLPSNRDTLLHFFEQIKKRYPTMRNFYARERGEYVLEEDKDGGKYRWVTVEPKRVSSGMVNPASIDESTEQHVEVLESIPYTLSISPLDCESLNYMMGFDFTYRGNHHTLLQEALGIVPAFERMLSFPGARLIANEPSIHVAFDEDCRLQCRVSIESRTSAYHIRTGNFPEEQLSVYMTVRRYGSLDADTSYAELLRELKAYAVDILDGYLIDQVLVPLQQAIVIK